MWFRVTGAKLKQKEVDSAKKKVLSLIQNMKYKILNIDGVRKYIWLHVKHSGRNKVLNSVKGSFRIPAKIETNWWKKVHFFIALKQASAL